MKEMYTVLNLILMEVLLPQPNFFLTDSSNHFFRGALYFNTQKSDSLAIIEEYLKVDVTRIIETFVGNKKYPQRLSK